MLWGVRCLMPRTRKTGDYVAGEIRNRRTASHLEEIVPRGGAGERLGYGNSCATTNVCHVTPVDVAQPVR